MELSDYPLDRQICGMQISSCKIIIISCKIVINTSMIIPIFGWDVLLFFQKVMMGDVRYKLEDTQDDEYSLSLNPSRPMYQQNIQFKEEI